MNEVGCGRPHCDQRHEQLLDVTARVAIRQRGEALALITRLRVELDLSTRRLAWVKYAATGGYVLTLHGSDYVPSLAITNALGLTDDVRYVTIKAA